MRIKACLPIIALALLIFAGCAGGERHTVTTPALGEWSDNVFTSEYLGLRFELPASWTVLSAADVARLRAQNDPALGAAGIDLPDDTEFIYDIAVMNLNTNSSVQIVFESVPGRARPTTAQAVEQRTELLENAGMSATAVTDTATTIGGYDWYSIETAITILRENWSGRQFLNYSEGYLRSIVMTYTTGAEDIDVMMSMFSDISAPPLIQRDAELIGSWVFDDDNWSTIAFEADGSGSSGFPGDMKSFEWRTLSDRHLLVYTDEMVESWTFAVLQNTLILTNRLNPDEIFGYSEAPPFSHPAELVDTWHHEWDTESFVFNEDGTGMLYVDDMEVGIFWRAIGDDFINIRLELMGTIFEEIVHFAIDGNLLIMDGIDIYYRDGTAPPTPETPLWPLPSDDDDAEHAIELLDVWQWDVDSSYRLVFFHEGFGLRGFPGAIEDFFWRTEGDDHLLIEAGHLFEESWTFTIEGDVLTITSRQVEGLTWSYIRAE